MDTDDLVLHPESPADVQAVDRLMAAAFRTEFLAPPAEVGLVHALRADGAWLPELCLVAEIGDNVVGQVTCSRTAFEVEPVADLDGQPSSRSTR